ncbi:CipA protein [Arthroderma uncinatum]|uniref:CipA protein n=1 Tax=Arthroderma uncinatum TaxID=74035 RepID=UPI00144A503C|nr:CipA protein [Arthroderma uncinatum]KAF3479629.1 CipA protein [Arthroderma uncinatum]
MAYLKNVAIVGATGSVGRFIVRELLAAGKHEVTAVTRTVSNAVMPDGVKVAKVDYDVQSTLVDALRGKDVLVVTMAPFAPSDTQLKLVEAAAEAGVPYVIPNGWGFDPNHPAADDAFMGPAQRAVIKRIEELGKSSWINFVSGFWYEFSLVGTSDRFGFDLQNRSVIFYDDGMARINTSTWDQTGRAVAKLLALKEKPDNADDDSTTLSSFKNKNVYFSSFYVTQKDMFQSVLRATGTKEEDWKITYEPSDERYKVAVDLMHQGNPIGFVRALYARGFYPEGSGNGSAGFEPTHGLQNDVLGLPKEDFDERTKVAVEKSEGFIRTY